MATIRANGIELAYESFGPPDAPAVLLIMGLGAQMTRWNRELCERLVSRGYRAIRFDNRDCGQSTWCHALPLPDLRAILRGEALHGLHYTLDDMAADSTGLLDALGIDSAHLVGASMGAAIAQLIAARQPRRCRSLTSIMSTSGNPALPPPTPAAAAALFAPLPALRDRASIVADAIVRHRAVASPAHPVADDELARMFGEEYDRGFHPPGVARQLGAVLANGDRRPLLRGIVAPTVVLHGGDDPLLPPACGQDVAKHIPGAELRLVPGMGHDFPPALTAVFADAICAAAQRA
jgi:pimeloyl-ACP methyl ester carboxylesterase